MELNIFMKQLETALVRRGIPNDIALKHVSNLRRTFTSNDLTEIEAIQTNDEIEELADSISVILTKNRKAVAPVPVEEEDVPSPTVKRQSMHTPQKPAVNPRPKAKETPYEYLDDDFYGDSVETAPTNRGLGIFWGGLLLTSPITLFLLAVIFGAFAAAFVGLAGLIVGGIVALIGLVAAGAVVALVGVIFGITQLFTFFAAGIYEIGLGIMVAGGVLFVSVLIYNFSVRLIPWVIGQLGNFLGFVCRKLKVLFNYVRRECYKL